MSIKIESAINTKQILAVVDPHVSLSVRMGNSGISADDDGKKIIYAGTPLYGNVQTRGTAFVKATTSAASAGNLVVPDGGGTVVLPVAAASNAVGVALHDVDVTSGDENGSILLFGFVNKNRLTADTQALITAEVIAALKGKITFLVD